jgi:hypothetical protein
VWLRYRQHDASACAQVSPDAYLQLRGFFLDWVGGEVERLGDPRVTAALRRARRQLRIKKLIAPFVGGAGPLLDTVRRRVPAKYKAGVKRALRRTRLLDL